jgi:succinate dehydrogenase / fumarate reductase cytochrome b subunit
MSNEGRPLSPHLSVYRWPIMMTLSILHRMTGVALSIGLIALVVWLEAVAFGASSYESLGGWMSSGIGQILLLGWCFSFFFHLSNGVRHLFWDAGRGFEKSQVNASSWMVIVATIVLTAGYWLTLRGML